MSQTLLFRADADRQTGSGHVMRCLAIAEAAAEEGLACRFAMQACPDGARDRLRRAGIEIDSLPPGGGPAAFLSLIETTAPAAVIIDGYSFDEDYRAAVGAAGPPVLAMDDLVGTHILHADLVANPSPTAGPGDYAGRADRARLLLGPEYAPLRKEFRQAAQGPSPALLDRGRILVTFGTSDPLRLSRPLVQRLAGILPEAVSIDLVLGGGHPDQEACEKLCTQYQPRLELHVDARNMAELMRTAGLAISAAGSTALELAAMGVPSLLVVTVENQASMLAAPAELGWCRVLDARAGTKAADIAALAGALWNDPAARRAMAEKAGNLIDGKGATRIVGALLDITGPKPRPGP